MLGWSEIGQGAEATQGITILGQERHARTLECSNAPTLTPLAKRSHSLHNLTLDVSSCPTIRGGIFTLNLATLLEASATSYPGKPAVIMGDSSLTYSQLNGAANQLAYALREAGIEPGDRVAIMIPNLPYFPLCYYGILKAGATVVPLNVLLKGREVAYHLDDSEAKLLIAFEMFAQEAQQGMAQSEHCEQLWISTADPAGASPVTGEGIKTLGQALHGKPPTFDTVQTMPDDTAVILYTSGTTGQPKGAELTH